MLWLLSAVLVMALPGAAHAADTATRFRVLPEAGVVSVDVTTTSGSVAVPTAARDVRASLDGVPLTLPTGVGRVSGTGALEVSFVLPHDPAGSGINVNPAYVWFPTRVWGGAGSSVEIRVPNDFEIKVDGAVLETEQQPGWTVMRAPSVRDPRAWDVTVSGRRDIALDTRIAGQAGHTYVLRSWPGSDEWQRLVGGVLDRALPRLAELTGIADPIGRPLIVSQSTDPERNGFDGWYIAASDTIEVGADPDVRVLVHETSHAWFNDDLVAERWLAEGLAETYTTLSGIGESTEPELGPTPVGPLAEWGHASLAGSAEQATERAFYAASWWVVDAIVADVGVDAMRDVFADLVAKRSAYAGPGLETTETPADWRRFLDVVERHGASPLVNDLVATHVVDAPAELAARQRAINRYTALADDPLGWIPPLGVREAMDRWDFTAADTRMDAAFAALAARDGLVAAGIDVSGMRSAYQLAEVPTRPTAPLPVPTETIAAPTRPSVDVELTAVPLAWTAAVLALGLFVAGRFRRQPEPTAVTSDLDLTMVDAWAGQLELFVLPSRPDPGPLTIIDLDELHRLDDALGDISQPTLFAAMVPESPADPWGDVVRTGGIARL